MTTKELIRRMVYTSKNGALYLEGRPGEGKTSIITQIAEEDNMLFIHFMGSQIPEEDVGGMPRIFPMTVVADDGVAYEVQTMKYAKPEFAVLANRAVELGYKGAIIFIDEFNRAKHEVQNAFMQLINERRIGYDFSFNKNVFFVTAGNLGNEDNCDVEEFDDAMNTRLHILRHTMPYDTWYTGYGKGNVNPFICGFLRDKPAYIFRKTADSKSFANYRTWTFLSNFIGTENKNINEIIDLCQTAGRSYVGESIHEFIRYMESMSSMNIGMIINNFERIEKEVQNLDRSKQSELLNELFALDLKKFTAPQIENIIKFLGVIHDDERMGFLNKICLNADLGYVQYDNETGKMIIANAGVKAIFKAYKESISFLSNTDKKLHRA